MEEGFNVVLTLTNHVEIDQIDGGPRNQHVREDQHEGAVRRQEVGQGQRDVEREHDEHRADDPAT